MLPVDKQASEGEWDCAGTRSMCRAAVQPGCCWPRCAGPAACAALTDSPAGATAWATVSEGGYSHHVFRGYLFLDLTTLCRT